MKKILFGILFLSLFQISFLRASEFLKNLKVDTGYSFFYDDNILYSTDENKVSSSISSFYGEISSSQSETDLFYGFHFKFTYDRYHSFSLPGDLEAFNYDKNKVDLSAGLEIGYKVTDRLVVKIKDNLERFHRPDFTRAIEIVYGKFTDNKVLFSTFYRLFSRTEVKFEAGAESVDYSRSDEAPGFEFINSNSKVLNLGIKYHFSDTFYFDFDYSRNIRDFDINILDYTDNVYFLHLYKVLDTSYFLETNIGVQDRSYDNSGIWENGSRFFIKTFFTINRERSKIVLNYTRLRSLEANYSEDFYTMNLFDVKFKYKLNDRNILFLNLGYRRDDFEIFPADFEDPLAGTRLDKYYNFNISYTKKLNSKLDVEVRYNRFKRDSNNIYFPFLKNVFAISLKVNIFGRGGNEPLIETSNENLVVFPKEF